jgi:hypothetical protein
MSKSKKKAKKPKQKKKLTAAQRRAKRERRRNFQRIFINGKQKWVRREPTIDGLSRDEFIARNADPIWLHQNELWELMPVEDDEDWPPESDYVLSDRDYVPPDVEEVFPEIDYMPPVDE